MNVNFLMKYAIEGLAVALVTSVIPKQQLDQEEIFTIALTAGVTFMVLDLLAPSIGSSARQGTGFGVGLGLSGVEGFCDSKGCGACSCGACHVKMGTADPEMGAGHGRAVSCPADPLGINKNGMIPPFGVSSEFKGNNIKVRNYSPGWSWFTGWFA